MEPENPRMHNPDGMYASEARNEDCFTLRDHFAAKAMQAIISTWNPTTSARGVADHLSKESYHIADEMLKQREL